MWKRSVQLIIGAVIGLTAIVIVVVGVDYERVWVIVSQANLALISLAVITIVANNCAKAWRWKLLLGKYGLHLSFWRLLHLHLAGQLLNQFLPARAGDLSRLYLSVELGVKHGFSFGTLALEKSIDLAGYISIGLLLLFLMPLPSWINLSSFIMVVVLLLVMGTVFTVVIYRRQDVTYLLERLIRRSPTFLRVRASRFAGDGFASLRVLVDPRLAINIILLSTVIWCTAVLTNGLLMQALNIDAPLVASMFVLFVLLTGINIISVPGQIGIFQYLCILSLGVFGIDQVSALSFGIVLHLLILTPMVLAGIASLFSLGLDVHSLSRNASDTSQH